MGKRITRSLLLTLMILMLTISITKSLGRVPAQIISPLITKNLFVPSEGCYIGAFIVNDPVVHGNISLFEQLTGKKHASYFTYSGYGMPFPIDWVNDVKAHGAVPHIAWEPNDGLDQVQDDSYLRLWAREAKKANCPIFLRFACEMNGNWVAWYTTNYTKYIEKFRLVYNVFKEEAPNVVLVWSPNWWPPDYDNWYPGHEYVDWVGVDFYSVHCSIWERPDPREKLRGVYERYSDIKPIMITEWAATIFCKVEKKPVPDYCIDQMNRIYENLEEEFPHVKMVNWFSMDATWKGESNYALTVNATVLNNYKRVISSSYFLSTIPYTILTGIIIECNPSTIMLRENTTISGRLFTLNSSDGMLGENVELSYSLDGVSWDPLTTVKTSSDGNYSYMWTPLKAGVYTIRASWNGNQVFDSASNTCTLNVQSNIFSIFIPIVALLAIGSVIILYGWSRHRKFKHLPLPKN